MSGTPTVVSLARARKARDRAADKVQADANAARHGRTKTQRLKEVAEAEKARRALDGAQRE